MRTGAKTGGPRTVRGCDCRPAGESGAIRIPLHSLLREQVAVETGMLNHAIIIRYQTGELATLHLCGNGTFGYPKELYEMMGNGAIVVVDHMCEVRTAGIPDVAPVLKFPLLHDTQPEIGTEGGIRGWLAFTSANGVELALGRLLERGLELRRLSGWGIAAIGPATAQTLRHFGLSADLVPETYTSEALRDALAERTGDGPVLLLRSKLGSPVLRELPGARDIAVYDQRFEVCPVSCDYLVLGSAAAARAYFAAGLQSITAFHPLKITGDGFKLFQTAQI